MSGIAAPGSVGVTMNNVLPPSATRGNLVPPVAGPASASASASVQKPVPEETYVGTSTPPSRAEWDFLVAEREAIMHEAGMASSRCLPMALADTQRCHGPRPQEAL